MRSAVRATLAATVLLWLLYLGHLTIIGPTTAAAFCFIPRKRPALSSTAVFRGGRGRRNRSLASRSRPTAQLQGGDGGDNSNNGAGPRPPNQPPPETLLQAGGSSGSSSSSSSSGSDTEEPFFLQTSASVDFSIDWSALTVAQLRDECTTRGLSLTGKKADLVARLEKSDVSHTGTGLEDPPAPTSPTKTTSTPATMTLDVDADKIKAVIGNVVDPLLPTSPVERGVSGDAIKGAAVTVAGLSALAGKGVAVSGLAGLSAAYAAISPGGIGATFRVLGELAWDAMCSAVKLTKLDSSEKLVNKVGDVITGAVKIGRRARDFSKKRLVGEDGEEQDDLEQLQNDVQEALEQAEQALIEADKIEAEKSRGADEKVLEKASEAKRLAEAKAAQKREQEAQEKARRDEEKEVKRQRAAAEAEAALKQEQEAQEQAKREEEEEVARRKKEEEEEVARQLAEAEKQAQHEAEEKARMAEGAGKTGDSEDDDFSEEDLIASIRAAQSSMGETIVGADDELFALGQGEKDDWEAAEKLAQQLGQDQPSDEELDLGQLAKATQDALAAFEGDMASNKEEKEAQKQKWEEEMVGLGSDVSDELDVGGGMDPEDLARIAREAVEMLDSLDDTEEMVEQERRGEEDYTKLKVVELRKKLRERGLPTKGRKAELVAALIDSDNSAAGEDLGEELGGAFDDDLGDLDMEEIAKAAREAMSLFDGEGEDEPSDEALWEIEQASSVPSSDEYDGMTVAQLKAECRTRGLRVGGRKAELIERLRSF